MTVPEIQAQAEALAAAIAALPTVALQFEALNAARAALHAVSPARTEPVDLVRWLPLDQVQGNTYNPNAVARAEMALLLRSMHHDGLTQPVVASWDAEMEKFVIVDGFHRFSVTSDAPEIRARTHGHLPVVSLVKTVAERMAATVRHNRARGKHSVEGMANMIFCLDPATRVLASDLRWVAIKDVAAGDELIGCDETLGPANKMRRSCVIAVNRFRGPRLQIMTDRGTVVATPDHRWVVVRRGKTARAWRRSADLRVGDRIAYYSQPVDAGTSYDAGWLAGFLDGEGHLQGDIGSVGFAQNDGPALSRALGILARDGFACAVHQYKACRQVLIRDPLRALGYYRPVRLLAKATQLWEGRRSWHKRTGHATVLKVSGLAEGEVCGLATTTGTLVADGMLSHNSMLDQGMDDAAICNDLGLEVEELVRLKHITGFSKLFENTEYRRAWVTKNQIRLKFAQREKEQGGTSAVAPESIEEPDRDGAK